MINDKLLVVLIAGFFTLAASIFAAAIAYITQKRLERIKQNANLKVQAYVDYIKGIAGLAAGPNIDKHKMAEFNSLILDAKMRIAMYGSLDAVKTLANFCANGNEMRSPDGIHRFLTAIAIMRRDFDKSEISEDDLYRLLYKAHPSH
ncbi:hypothetical protein HDF24_18065 [Mucilaginibacter sp. X4EP1]|uniref:hypothetical protein n=1 Tax=Mucilaginibacter sp. X4EP1 TaxID=2723092 RepID=UPI00216A968A|nr:hypothetical protein [Mucilaginibacter sp. X4EP1]MCS3813523.1 integrase [Mucilaginibacter sp. X4EP1]